MTSVYLVDDHQIVREGLKALIDKEADLSVVGDADNGREAIRQVRKLQPDVAVMDVSMPELNGVEATRKLLEASPGTRVVALSVHSDRQFVANMLGAGALAYVLKEGASRDLLAAIRSVAGNRHYLSPDITGVVVEDFVRLVSRRMEDGDGLLTAREREVLQLLAEGRSTKESAERLHVSVKTIEATRQNIRGKVGVSSIAELTRYAIKTGLISVDG